MPSTHRTAQWTINELCKSREAGLCRQSLQNCKTESHQTRRHKFGTSNRLRTNLSSNHIRVLRKSGQPQKQFLVLVGVEALERQQEGWSQLVEVESQEV